MIFTKGKAGRITHFNKWMIALDSCATNGVCPHEELLTNITEENNEMICGGSHVIGTSKRGDLNVMG